MYLYRTIGKLYFTIGIILLLLHREISAQRVLTGAYNEVWLTPTQESDDSPYFIGGMPLGNGDTQILAWANTSVGGVSVYISKQNALASDASNYKLALLTISLSPNPFTMVGGGDYFNQTLDISSGTVLLQLGGTSKSPAVTFSVWVDALSNTGYVAMVGNGSTSFTFQVQLTPVRPVGYPPYAAPWMCTTTSSAPDVVVNPVPPNGGFPSGNATLIVLHENLPTDRSVPLVNSTLTTQQLASIIDTVPDPFIGRRFGVAIDTIDNGCATFQRSSPLVLSSVAPSTCATVRITTRSTQKEASIDDWLTALGAQVASAPSLPPRTAHEAWWQTFWTNTFVDIETSSNKSTGSVDLPPDSLLWLQASALNLANGSAVSGWGGPTNDLLVQANTSQRPIFLVDGFHDGLPGVRFFQEQLTFLSSSSFSLPTSDGATIIAVLKDQGSNGGTANPKSIGCCSGVVSFLQSFFGISTFPAPSIVVATDDDSMGHSDDPLPNGHGISVLGDFSGSNLASTEGINAAGRTVVAAVVYSAGTATLYIDGCVQANAPLPGNIPPSVGLFVGTRGADEYERYFEGLLGDVVIYSRALTTGEILNATDFFTVRYNLPINSTQCTSSDGFQVSKTYAMSRYMNCVQSRIIEPNGVVDQQPIKFNGLAWKSNKPGTGDGSGGCPPGLGPDCRQWGSCANWWQNLRFGSISNIADGDWEQLDVMFGYYLRMVPFLRARAQTLLPGADQYPDMIWQTETATIFGSFAEIDWVGSSAADCTKPRPADLPPWLQNNPYIYLDAFGDGPTAELSLLILDAYLYDQNETALTIRLPWVFGALDYFAYKFYHDGIVDISPTQACETLWSPWPITNTSERVIGDAPTIAVVTRLLERTLTEVPPELLPIARSQLYTQILKAMPPLPLGGPNGTLLAPAIFTNGQTHNSESISMYSVHPARHFSVGRLLTGGVSTLAPAIATFYSDPNSGGSSGGNNGWHQAALHSPLLGLRNDTARLLVERTVGTPLPGYRFPFFSAEDGMSDEPALEVFSNLQAGVQFALLQPGENSTIVTFPGWPCDWNVHFKLRGPVNTTIEGVWQDGKVLNLTVVPAWRMSSVIVAEGC